MNEHKVNELLELADAGTAMPEQADAGLADRAIRLARRRTRNRRLGLGVLAIDAAAAVVLWSIWFFPMQSPGPRATPTGPTFTAVPHAESVHGLDTLRARIEMQESVVRVLLAAQPAGDVGRAESPDPLDAIRRRIDRAARQMVLTADRIEHDAGPSDFTRGLYKDVVTNFPDTGWARLARQRIDEQDDLTEPRSAL